MTLTTISIIVANAIYLAYNAISLAFFGIPESLSNTYYLWKERSNKGWLFPLMMYAVVAFMMPAWITMSEGSDFQFLAFLAPAAIALAGTKPTRVTTNSIASDRLNQFFVFFIVFPP